MAQVLVIDGDDGICATLRLLLTDAGYTVESTDRPELAARILQASAWPVIVLFDAGIPRMSDGRIPALALINDPVMRRHAYICMTTSAGLMVADLRQALTSLGVPIVEKPFDLDVLLGLVGQAAYTLSPQVQRQPE